MAEAGEGLSKSARQRAAKKAREAAAAAEGAAPAPAAAPPPPKGGYPAEPAPKAKAKAKAAPAPEPAKAEPKAKAKAKAEPKAEAKAEPKAKAKAKAEPAPPPPEPPQASAKSKSKKNKETKPEPVKEEPMKKQKSPGIPAVEMDDGTGGDWDVCSGLSKKQQKYKDRKDEEKRALDSVPQAAGGKYIPGLTAAAPAQKAIPGMAPGKGQPAASQALAALPMPPKPDGTAAEKPKPDNSTMVQIKVPDDKIGIVIGPKGAKIKMIQEKTGVTRIDTSGEVFTITGPAEAVGMAEQAVNDLIHKGYTALTFDDFSENFVMVMPNNFPDLIGKQGCVIRAIKDTLHCEISIPKTGPPGKKWKVSVAGSAKNVEKAKEVIDHIVLYSHHEITHPGEDHVELDIPAWAYSFIIGKAGSELRHIQNNFKVKVNIPREGVSENQNVLIVGEKDNVARASVYVQKLLDGANDVAKGRDRQDKAEDPWGNEEPEEDWMKQYMYKRR
jgi:rRNA processing protein Krr1/Pno1